MFNLFGLLSFTIGTIYQKKMGSNHHPVCALFWQFFISVILFFVLGNIFYGNLLIHLNWESSAIILWQGIIINIFSWALLIHLLKKYSATVVASLLLIVPALTSIESWFLFNQQLTLLTTIAIITTILGVYLVVKPPKEEVDEVVIIRKN